MEKEFIHYEQALALRELGFDEPCFGRFYTKPKCKMFSVDEKGRHYQIKNTPKKLYTVGEYFVLNDDNAITAPTFSQAFRWFREKYNLHSEPYTVDMGAIEYCFQIRDLYSEKYVYDNFVGAGSSYGGTFNNYEEAELECLKKLIEIVNK